jgi:predicted HD phosphohydrolase
VETFKGDPLWEEKVSLRRWDDGAKRTDINAPGLETFRPIVERAQVQG